MAPETAEDEKEIIGDENAGGDGHPDIFAFIACPALPGSLTLEHFEDVVCGETAVLCRALDQLKNTVGGTTIRLGVLVNSRRLNLFIK